jgi:hypothetical protein
LGPRDVNAISFQVGQLPESLARRPSESSLVDVAVGTGSVEMTKYLLEFHSARPTRETLKQSISTGNLELIKLVRERLPEGVLRDRVDLLEGAAEFHQNDVLVWLLRDATVFERELLWVFALEQKLAYSLEVAGENGFRPWWSRTREVSLKWRATAKMIFASAPEGFSAEDGWWTALSGTTSALRRPGREACVGRRLSEGRRRVRPGIEFEWTREISPTQWGDPRFVNRTVKSVVFPWGVTAIGERALYYFEALESVMFPVGCSAFGKIALDGCEALKAVSIPVGCKATGHRAFAECKSLANVLVPAGCVTISDFCFTNSSSLTGVKFPDGLTLIGEFAFWRGSLREVVIPDGCRIGGSAFSSCYSLTKVTVGRGCTSIGNGAFSDCEALVTVTIGEGLTSIGDFAFADCGLLAAMTLPSSVQGIGKGGFQNCRSLATIAIPNGCQMQSDVFWGVTPRVTRF